MLNQSNETWKVKNIEMDGLVYRLYNESTTSAEFSFYIETVYKIHKLIEKYEFRLYHLKTSPKTNLILKFDSKNRPDIHYEDVKKIKFLQSNDYFYLYMNLFFEVFYSIPHLNNNNNYSYEMLILTQKDFDITKISNHNFNLVNIENCIEIKKEQINFAFIENFFESRSIINNSSLTTGEYEYDYSDHDMSVEEFIKYHNNGNSDWDLDKKVAASTFKSKKKFNQNTYAKIYFKCLCTHILGFGRNYYIEHNKNKNFDIVMYDDLYESVGLYFSNFGELSGLKVVDVSGGIPKFNNLEHYVCTVHENCNQMDIFNQDFSKEFVLNGFINLDNKEVRVSIDGKKTAITNIIV